MMATAFVAWPVAGRAEPQADWHFGGAAGLVFDSFGGRDDDLTDGESGTGYVVAARAGVGLPDLPFLRARADLGLVERRLGETVIYHLDAPVILQVEHPLGRVTPFAGAGLEIGWAIGGSYREHSDSEGRADLDLDPLHLAAVGSVGARIRGGTLSWVAEIRYSHGLRTIDPESPGLDIRHRTWLVLGGAEW
jgi:hypothetical protein